ncbi:TsoY family (seleno)protein [Micrococcoides hystricis]|uniref:Uncharacterized protein n=1 Tax=Micrococcoides hystricis TaxID=1572761 RepID=A0ABV6P8K1_9MICC
MIKNLGEKYSPLYFLASLGFGGMGVFFFMYFMFLTPHPDTAMPTFNSISTAFASGSTGMQTTIVIAYIGMIAMIATHFALLAWNFREFNIWKKTPAYDKLRNSNAAVTLLAIPLTLGMSVNGLFVLSATLIPNLWNVIEYAFPFALLAFTLIGLLAVKYLWDHLSRVFSGKFSFEANGGLNQILAAFAFAMVAVGFAASAAMSEQTWTILAGMIGSILFAITAVLLWLMFFTMGVYSMLKHGLAVANSATLWLTVPILTLLGIMVVRDSHGVQTFQSLAGNPAPAGPGATMGLMIFLTVAILMQVVFLVMGHLAMRKNGFYKEFVFSRNQQSPNAFTLVCPGVAFGVLGFFWIHAGLVNNGIIERYSAGYFVLVAIMIAVQVATLALMAVLVKNQLRPALATEKSAVVSA